MRHDTGSVIDGQNFRCLYDNFLTFQNFCVSVFFVESLPTSLQFYVSVQRLEFPKMTALQTQVQADVLSMAHIAQILNWAP